jgi:hypothetical protein
MPKLLNIRLLQIKRELKHTGAGVIILSAIFVFLIYVSYITFQKTPDAYFLTLSLLLICIIFQTARKDKSFIFNHIENPEKEIYYEYLVLTFPFAITALLTENRICYPVLICALTVVPFIKYTPAQQTYFKNISKIIPASNFEWISGFRKSFPFIIPIYFLAVAFCWFKLISLFLLWFVTVTIASFYTENESLRILKAGGFNSAEFLKHKLFTHSKYLIIIYTPLLIVNLIFNFEYWPLIILFIPVQTALLCFAICLKYSDYRPGMNSSANNIILMLVSFGCVIPFLLPVPLIMAVLFYKKALNNLDNYLYD